MATTTLLALKSQFFKNLGMFWSGTVTGGTANTLVDSTLIDLCSGTFPTVAEGWQLRITSGLASGDLRQVVDVDKASGTLRLNRVFSDVIRGADLLAEPPRPADIYELWGNSIYGGQPLTDLFNEVLKVARPLDETQVTIVTGQRFYDITATIGTVDAFRGAYVRELDPTGVLPYTPRELYSAAVSPKSVLSTYTVTMEISPVLALDAAARELWVRHVKQLTAFTTDTSTVDAKYADWLAWRAVLLHAVTMAHNEADRSRWQTLATTAAARVRPLDKLFMPAPCGYIRHARPQYT